MFFSFQLLKLNRIIEIKLTIQVIQLDICVDHQERGRSQALAIFDLFFAEVLFFKNTHKLLWVMHENMSTPRYMGPFV